MYIYKYIYIHMYTYIYMIEICGKLDKSNSSSRQRRSENSHCLK